MPEELDVLAEDVRRSLRELDWWRTIFAGRFNANNLPRVGECLYGARFVLMTDNGGAKSVRYKR